MKPVQQIIATSVLLASCGGGGGGSVSTVEPPTPIPPGNYRVLAANDLGMHCMDREFSSFSILPPFNVLRAQVVYRNPSGQPRLLNDLEADVTYEPVADPHGSINSHSVGKTDFWSWAHGLFGVNLPAGQGLTGLYLPGDGPNPGPQAMAWNSASGMFQGFGIPITPIDDAGATNPYPLLRVRAKQHGTTTTLATVDAVVPVSGETDCRNCHVTGQIAARRPGIPWSTETDTDLQSKHNVMILHDTKHATELMQHQPVLCASCHRSPPLELAPPPPGALMATPLGSHFEANPMDVNPPQLMSRVMHEFHGRQLNDQGGPLFPPGGDALSTCYQCHPGAITECLRGAMQTGGMSCFECHGDMLSVGGAAPLLSGGSIDGTNDGHARRPWQDMPRCQSCHTGDALNHLSGPAYVAAADGIRLRQAWIVGDESASAISSPASRFAEEPNKLYRFSKGHAGISCEGCHGSTHAEWPVAPGANDNLASLQIQGHAGTITECAACHTPGTLPSTMNGPHGMHNVNQANFVDHQHANFYETNPTSCQACHGANLLGTALSRAADDRSWTVEGHAVSVPKGTPVACNICHQLPGSGGDD